LEDLVAGNNIFANNKETSAAEQGHESSSESVEGMEEDETSTLDITDYNVVEYDLPCSETAVADTEVMQRDLPHTGNAVADTEKALFADADFVEHNLTHIGNGLFADADVVEYDLSPAGTALTADTDVMRHDLPHTEDHLLARTDDVIQNRPEEQPVGEYCKSLGQGYERLTI
jgi:hypothetical protein